MTKKNALSLTFQNERTVVKHNDKILPDSDVLNRIHQIIGKDQKKLQFEIKKDKFVPSNPAQFSKELDSYYLLQRSIEQRLSFYFLSEPEFVPTLYNFQVYGVNWLKKGLPLKILADDMGIGKTAQSISALNDLTKEGNILNTLIIAPGSLIQNWLNELILWAPNLLVSVITPPASIREEAWSIVLGNNHVYLTTYDQLKLLPEKVKKFKFDLAIADEAQNLKSPNTEMYKAIKNLNLENLWLLTGTPVENSKSDLINLLTLTKNSGVIAEDKNLSEKEIRSLSKRYILRRNKKDILSDLPKLNEQKLEIELNQEQKEEYSKIIKEYKSGLSNKNPLQILTELRKICDVSVKNNSSSKIDEVIRLVQEAMKKDEKVVIFSFKVEPLELLSSKLKAYTKPLIYTGRLSKEKRDDVIKEFKSSEKANVLLASIQLAGVGLTLVEANHVIFFNEWWNPSINLQARDRVNRIGQKKDVFITSFLVKNTIDERLQIILEEKKRIFSGVVEELNEKLDYDSIFSQMNDSEIDDLINYGQ